jgi:hypothetical protein
MEGEKMVLACYTCGTSSLGAATRHFLWLVWGKWDMKSLAIAPVSWVLDRINSICQNATRWDSKPRVMEQEKFSPQGRLRVIIELSGKPEVGSFSSLFKQLAIANKQFCVLDQIWWLSGTNS